jgi:hypothetical protein
MSPIPASEQFSGLGRFMTGSDFSGNIEFQYDLMLSSGGLIDVKALFSRYFGFSGSF